MLNPPPPTSPLLDKQVMATADTPFVHLSVRLEPYFNFGMVWAMSDASNGAVKRVEYSPIESDAQKRGVFHVCAFATIFGKYVLSV